MIKVQLLRIQELIGSNKVIKMSKEMLKENEYPLDSEEYFSNGCVYPKDSNKTVYITNVIPEESVALLSNGYYVDMAWLSPSVTIFNDYIKIGTKPYNYNLEPIVITTCELCNNKVSTFSPDGCSCMKCFTKNNSKLNTYSYKPAPKFIGEQLSTDKDNPVRV